MPPLANETDVDGFVVPGIAGVLLANSNLISSLRWRPPQLAASFISNVCDVGCWHFSTDCAVRWFVCYRAKTRHSLA